MGTSCLSSARPSAGAPPEFRGSSALSHKICNHYQAMSTISSMFKNIEVTIYNDRLFLRHLLLMLTNTGKLKYSFGNPIFSFFFSFFFPFLPFFSLFCGNVTAFHTVCGSFRRIRAKSHHFGFGPSVFGQRKSQSGLSIGGRKNNHH